MNLTTNFTLEELVHSDTALTYNIDNTPTTQSKDNLQNLATTLLQPVRESLGEVIKVNSGYRGPALNRHPSIGGAPNSYHTLGLAADLVCGSNHIVIPFRWNTAYIPVVVDGTFGIMLDMIVTDLPFDKIIHEYGTLGAPKWLHVQLPKPGREPRREIWVKEQGRAYYQVSRQTVLSWIEFK